ncbi:hypothetical protein OAO01_09680, partial [Oligoflexia bacterium]|nr:hypothetical protein [Oligoflexia bacterium]
MIIEAPDLAGLAVPSGSAIEIPYTTQTESLRTKLSTLKPDTVLDAKVVANKEGHAAPEKGLVILDEFIAVRLSDNLKPGQAVTVRVVENGDTLKLQITPSKQEDTRAEVVSNIKQILKALNFSDEQLEQLKSAARGPGAIQLSQTTSPSGSTASTTGLPANLLDKLMLVQEEVLGKPQALFQALVEKQGSAAVHNTQQALAAVDQLTYEELSPQALGALRKVEEQIRKLLAAYPKDSTSRPEVKESENQSLVSPAPMQREVIKNSVVRLIQLLQPDSIGKEAPTEKALVDTINQQLEYIKAS